MQLSEEERDEYYLSLGLTENGLAILARSLYRLLNLCTFFTINEKELHAWSLLHGAAAVEAAAAVHTDFAKGFVKAEVYSVEDLEVHHSESALRHAGRIRSEGRDYIVQDGDIILFKSAP
jgi:ribosome-binding ATPase YchF (GTP1/OBG family)